MLERKKTILEGTKELVLGLDLEWTKNYKIKNGNKPFCFSFAYFSLVEKFSNIEKGLDFGFESYYLESENEIPLLINKIDSKLGEFLNRKSKIYIVGHQLSSDIGVLMNLKKHSKLRNISKLSKLWKERSNSNRNGNIIVFDTRYDLKNFLEGKSRRLVDVCEEIGLNVTQNEISGSMTKMQKSFLDNKNRDIFEKIAILNLRHSLSSAILFNLFLKKEKPQKTLFVNEIIHRNTKKYFNYLNNDYFINSIYV